MSSNGAPERRAQRTSPRRRPRASTFHQDEGGGAAPCRSPRAPNASGGWIARACEPRLCRCSSRSPRCSPTHLNRAGSSLVGDISQRSRPMSRGPRRRSLVAASAAAWSGIAWPSTLSVSALPLWDSDISVLRCRCAKRQRGTTPPSRESLPVVTSRPSSRRAARRGDPLGRRRRRRPLHTRSRSSSTPARSLLRADSAARCAHRADARPPRRRAPRLRPRRERDDRGTGSATMIRPRGWRGRSGLIGRLGPRAR